MTVGSSNLKQITSRFCQNTGNRPGRRIGAALLAVIVAAQTGCSTLSHKPRPPAEPVAYETPETHFQTSLGKVAIVTEAQVPHAQFEGYARSKSEAAAKMAGTGMLACLVGPFMDPRGWYVIVIWVYAPEVMAGICGVIVPSITGTVGGIAAPGEKEILAAEAAMSKSLNAGAAQDALFEEISADAQADGASLVAVPPEQAQMAAKMQDYRPLAAMGVDTVLEVKYTQQFANVGSGNSNNKGFNPPLLLNVWADVRLVRTSDNSEIFTDSFSYSVKRAKYTEWAANHADLLVRTLKTYYEAIGHNISDRIYLLYPFPSRQEEGMLRSCGLAPIYPDNYKTVVGDLHPALSWQSFPRASDTAAAPDEMARVKNVRYDLIVAVGENREPPAVVYRREGLPEPKDKIEINLKPHTRYFWSARARFNLDGRERVTEWGTRCPFEQQLIVDSHLYRFYTPRTIHAGDSGGH